MTMKCGLCREEIPAIEGSRFHGTIGGPLLCGPCHQGEERSNQAPCLECGAADEYQAEEMCICGGDKDNCHGNILWG